jgi:DSBA-like thioredoxin domain
LPPSPSDRRVGGKVRSASTGTTVELYSVLFSVDKQGKFWEYHDALFSQQDKLGDALYLEIAQNLNLDLEKFERDRTLTNNAIAPDIQLAEKLGISGTPFFVMNGFHIFRCSSTIRYRGNIEPREVIFAKSPISLCQKPGFLEKPGFFCIERSLPPTHNVFEMR